MAGNLSVEFKPASWSYAMILPFCRLPQGRSITHRQATKSKRRARVTLDQLEDRRLLTIAIYGNDGAAFSYLSAFAGVGFALNPVAEITGSYNGQVDNAPGDYNAQIDWGDGKSSAAQLTVDPFTGYVLAKGSHVYSAKGDYDVTVNVTGPGGQTASATTSQVTVTPLPDAASIPPDVPTDEAGAEPLGDVSLGVYGNGGSAISYLSAFTGVGFSLNPVAEVQGFYNGLDDKTLSDYHAQINWGDSPTWDSNAALTLDSSTGFVLVKGSHNYQASGTYDITVYITGPDGQTASATTSQVTVTPLPDAASIPPDVPTDEAGAEPLGDVSLGVYGNGGSAISYLTALAGVSLSPSPVAEVQGFYNGQEDKTLSDYQAQINWGDSPTWDTSTTLALDSSTGFVQVEGDHTYQSRGTYDVTVYITGPDGQTASAVTSQVEVSANPVSVSLNAPSVNNANAASEVPYAFSLSFQDGGGMISASSVAAATVQVVPPQGAAVTAVLVSQQATGSTDGSGDGSTITANYQITPPSGDWTGAPQGSYSVTLTGSPVTGLSGGEAPPGTVGNFAVNLAVKLVLEVAQADTSVPEGGTISLEVQAVGPSGSPDPGVTGTATLMLNGRVVDNVYLQNGTGSATITAPAAPGPYQLQGDLNNLNTGNTGINVEAEQPSTSEILGSAANAAGQLAELLKGLLEEDLKDPNEVAQAALKDLEGLKNTLGKVVPVLNLVPLALDLGSLWNDATQKASPQNQAQFEKDFSNALKEAVGLDVAWGVALGLELNPIGAVGGFLLNSSVQQGVNAFYDTYLKAGAMTTAGQLYQAFKGTGSSVILYGGVQYAAGSGDPPPSLVVVNPPNAASAPADLTIAGQAVHAQAGTSFNGVVATFLDASGNTSASAYNAYIAWGDGNFTQGTVSALPGGGFEVSGTDTYTATGLYSVCVIVTSASGSSAAAYNSATIYPAGPAGATPAPVVTLLAPNVTAVNADWLSPYTFSLVYQDAAMVSYSSLSGSTVEVKTPTGTVIPASEISTQALGSTDQNGDATTLIVTYEITPPSGNWYAAAAGNESVLLGGSAVTDLSGHPVTLGSVGMFQAEAPPTLQVSPTAGTDPSTGAAVSNSETLTLSGLAEAGSMVTIDNGSLELGTTKAAADGSWSYAYHAPQNGTYDFTVTSRNTAGNTSAASDSVALEVDTATPTSTVAALPAEAPSATFAVSWSGNEGTNEPGITYYNVYVSDNGAPFTLFQADTVATSAVFTGQAGHTYAFYSVATDYAGNAQPTPATAQAMTTVPNPPAPLVTVQSAVIETIKIGTGKKARKRMAILIEFTGALSAGAADNSRAYELAPIIMVKASGKGKHRKPATTKLGVPVPVASAIYASDQVTLLPLGKPAPSKPKELIVNGALITDTSGRGIDGGGTGQSGSDYIATIRGTRVTVGGIPLARIQWIHR